MIVIVIGALALAGAVICLVAWLATDTGATWLYAAMALAVVALVVAPVARRVRDQGSSSSDAAGGSGPTGERTRRAARSKLVVLVTDGAVDPRYDRLWVTQIVPAMTTLDESQLDVVEDHERANRRRAAVLDAIAERRATIGSG